jgi:hypothetical protein
MRTINLVICSILTLSLFGAPIWANDLIYKVDKKRKGAPIIIKITGAIIDNISLKSNKNALEAFLPGLTKQTLIANAKSGYSIYLTNKEVRPLIHESTESLWNTFRNMKNSTFRISGNAQILGDSLLILDYYCLDK